MRVRKRKWVEPFLQNEQTYLLRSRELLEEAIAGKQAYIEIGCGHGEFLCAMGKERPDLVYIGFEKDRICVARAIRKAMENELSNVYFINGLAERSEDILGDTKFDGMYLQFSDPWPKSKHYARRLTYRSFLQSYARVLKPEAFLYFKTDNLNLFEFTLEELAFSVFVPQRVSRDFHQEIGSHIMTAYETKFSSQGMPIYHILCGIDPQSQQPDVPRTSGTPEILRNKQAVSAALQSQDRITIA